MAKKIFKSSLPATPEALAASKLYNSWWYYSIELMPELITKGLHAADTPNLPRMMLRRVNLEGMSCLDIGTMEGLIPILMCRAGARNVLAIDYNKDQFRKLDAVKHYYGEAFERRSVGLMYDLAGKLRGKHFDFINCSGLLYHVYSPMLVLAGIRPLLSEEDYFLFLPT